MDELDRLFTRLVQNLRAAFPDHLARPFEVAELYQTVVPYRLNRRELGVETNQDYEMALMRLLSGERGYLVGDPSMQDALQRELASPNPDTTAFREFAMTSVSLAPEAVRWLDAQPLNAASTPAPRGSNAQPATRQSVGVAASPPLPPPPIPGAPGAPAPRASAVAAPSVAAPRASASGSSATPMPCRYCGGELPKGRAVTFCPHCGQNLTVQQCPACSTELEVGWKFCTTCGRAVGG